MRTVTHVQMTKALFVPTLLELKRTLGQQFYPGIIMKLHPEGIISTFKGVTFLVPYSLIECVVLEEVKDTKGKTEASGVTSYL